MNGSTILIALIAVVAVLLAAPALAMLGMMGTMMGTGGMMGQPAAWTWPGGIMMLSWVLVAVGIVMLATWGIRALAHAVPGAREKSPLVVLQRRYARGELKPEEYQRIRADLLRDGGDR